VLLVLAPDTTSDGAATLADRIGAAVSSTALPAAAGDAAITVSVGAATLADGDDAEALVRRAEAALRPARLPR